LPIGMGLSSSAAYSVALTMALEELRPDSPPLTELELARLCVEVEHEATGVACGLMDPYASVFGRRGFALFLDCAKEMHLEVPLNIGDTVLMVIDSARPRDLAHSGYNRRRRELDELLASLREKLGAFDRIWDVPQEQLELASEYFAPALRSRLRHFISEEARVLAFVDALGAGDLKRMGELLLESHRSLSDDYEVSCEELDFLVDELEKHSGVYGARLVGGGFGGSVLAILSRAQAADVSRSTIERYEKEFALKARTMAVQSGNGAEVKRV